jgi:hypothetical protein
MEYISWFIFIQILVLSVPVFDFLNLSLIPKGYKTTAITRYNPDRV